MAVKIPQVNTDDKDLNLYQTQVGKVLTPIIGCPILFGGVVQSFVIDSNGTRTSSDFVNLVSGSNIITHQLNRKPQGYFIIRQKQAANIYDTWDNQNQDLSSATFQPLDKIITFNSSAPVTVTIWLF